MANAPFPIGEIQLTVIDVDRPPFAREELWQTLSPDERERADRFRFPLLRERFRTGRGMLRSLLGKASGTAPERLRFQYSLHGKPSIPDFPAIHFSASHSGDLWACALATAPVGLDIEQVRPFANYEGIARRFFANSEAAALEQLPESKRLAGFFRCWTRKEAYVKALGEGLSRGLETFEVSCRDEVVSPVRDTLSPDPWLVTSFLPATNYTGAIATPGKAGDCRTITEA